MGDSRAEETFDQAIKLLREAFNQRAAAKDAEIARLRNEIARRDGKIEELQKRVSRLIDDLQRATQQNTSLSTEVARLYTFRQSILESFDDRDLSDLRTAGTTSDRSLNDSLFDLKGPSIPARRPAVPESSQGTRLAAGTSAAVPAPTPGAAAPAASTGGATQVIDGSAFFALAQSRLSYDKFNVVLAQIQRYNRRERTKDEVIEAVAAQLENKHRDVLDGLIALLNPGQPAPSAASSYA